MASLDRGPETELREQLADLLGDELEEVHDVLALPEKRERSVGFWVATPTGQVSRWQTRIRMQPETTSGRSRSRTPLGAEQRGDDDVATGLELAVGLHRRSGRAGR